MPKNKFKTLKVTITQKYLIEMIDDKRTVINGWTIKEVVEDWFKNSPLDSFHATRDTHKIGGGSQFIEAEVEVI